MQREKGVVDKLKQMLMININKDSKPKYFIAGEVLAINLDIKKCQ